MITFPFKSCPLVAVVRGKAKQRDGGFRAAVDFKRGDLVLFTHATSWTDAVERGAVAEKLGKLTGTSPEDIAADLMRMEGAIACMEDVTGLASVEQTTIESLWPAPPGEPAFAGLAGRVVISIEPHSEADPIAILVNFLTAFGNCVGNGPHFMVGATRHSLNLFSALVGDTAKARKGDSWPPVRVLFQQSDPQWTSERVTSGLTTGEGLIWQVRDPIEKNEPVKEKGRVVGYELVITDHGISDKRLLVFEPELARALQAMSRSGNTLSPVVRDAWDRGNLNILSKTNAARATDAHVSVIAHITREELLRELSDVEVANGFANRLMWFAVRRSKLLPEPEPFDGPHVEVLADELRGALSWAGSVGQLRRDSNARDLWAQVYPELSAAKSGLAGAIVARGEAQTMRLAALYALLDHSELITPAHLTSALELWAYAERSAMFIWADSLGDPTADTIHFALRQNGRMSRTDISNLFGRHANATQIDTALQALVTSGRARSYSDPTAGRPMSTGRHPHDLFRFFRFFRRCAMQQTYLEIARNFVEARTPERSNVAHSRATRV